MNYISVSNELYKELNMWKFFILLDLVSGKIRNKQFYFPHYKKIR